MCGLAEREPKSSASDRRPAIPKQVSQHVVAAAGVGNIAHQQPSAQRRSSQTPLPAHRGMLPQPKRDSTRADAIPFRRVRRYSAKFVANSALYMHTTQVPLITGPLSVMMTNRLRFRPIPIGQRVPLFFLFGKLGIQLQIDAQKPLQKDPPRALLVCRMPLWAFVFSNNSKPVFFRAIFRGPKLLGKIENLNRYSNNVDVSGMPFRNFLRS